ncbi:50S ribosomal protein 6 chloroplastic [Bienertia sinuspersici]
MKSRPKKTQPWDIRRRPAVYAPLPPLPPDFTVVSSGEDDVDSSSSSLPESVDSKYE